MTAPNLFGRTLILGHRGSPLEAPENTIRAFQLAMAAGADGVELDVQITGDRIPVVIHDATLDRTTDGTGPLAALRADALAAIRSVEEPIPILQQVAGWSSSTGAWLNVEIKATGIERETVDVLSAAGLGERVVVSSFEPETVREVGRIAPKLRRFLLLERWDRSSAGLVQAVGAQGVCLAVDAAASAVVEEIHSLGLPIIVWTVDDPPRIRQLLEAGVAGIITNRPADAVRVKREIEG